MLMLKDSSPRERSILISFDRPDFGRNAICRRRPS